MGSATSNVRAAVPQVVALCARVMAEFREMPGLRITLPQATRLFSLEPDECERVLRTLVDLGVLRTDGRLFAATGKME